MKKWLLALGALCFPVVLTGCGTDEREAIVAKAVDRLNQAASSLRSVKDNVSKWATEVGDAEKAKLLNNAIRASEDIRKVGQDFQEYKSRIDKLGPLSKDDRDKNLEKFGGKLRSSIENLHKEMTDLDQAFAAAEKTNATALEPLRKKLREAQAEFEVLIKSK
jgi:oligoendopeptidase F